MSTLASPFLIDNYTSKGERLVVSNIQTLKAIADIEPPHNQIPLAMAIDHRAGRTTVLVNWGSHWEYKQFPDR